MKKGKVARVAGFVGALGVSAVLVTTAVQGTGAYFTASQDGSISGTTGQITISANNPTTLNFDNLIPGEYKDSTIQYTVGGDTHVDTWLVFQDGYAYCKFTGAKDDSHCGDGEGGMGRFGHFAVEDNAGNLLFSSYNLANANGTTSDCVDAFGHGSRPPAADKNDTNNRCGVPLGIKLQSDLSPGNSANVTLTFGVTGRQTDQNVAAPPATVPFQIVATQVGITPTADNY
jgi:hypothetical protein